MPTTMKTPPLVMVPSGTPNSMRCAVLDAVGKIGMQHAMIPTPKSHEVRVKITYVGICGSDLETYRGCRAPEFFSTPMRLGHEVAGVLDAVGDKVVGLCVGDQVTCRYVWGAFAEYIVCEPFNVKVLPPAFPKMEISLIEILPGVIHAAELAKITPHTNVIIMGQGVSGLVITQVCRMFSPKSLVVTDLKDRNLELAKKYGATHVYKIPDEHASTPEFTMKDFPDGFEVVIPCLLDGDKMQDALDLLALGGRIVMYGCIGPCKYFDFFKLHRKRGEIYSTEPRRDVDMRRWFQEGVQMVLDGTVNTSEMITHVYPLERVQEAFDLRNNKDPSCEAIHVMIDCEVNADGTVKDIVKISHEEKPARTATIGGGGGGGGGEESGCCGGHKV